MTTFSFFCACCNESIEHDAPEDNVYEGIQAVTDHFRALHPEVFATIQTWPDGSPVVVDEPLTPQDFADDEPGETASGT